MIDNIAQLMAHLNTVGSKLYTPTTVYLVQGSALLFRGLKDNTSDIDVCCDYQDANRLVAALRPHGKMECLTGVGGVKFLRFFLKCIVVDIFIRDMWCGDEYALLKKATCDQMTFGFLTCLVPGTKTLLMIKDRQAAALLLEVKSLNSQLEER